MDSVILTIIFNLRDKLYKWTKDDYGLKEAIFFPKEIDVYIRYSKIINELRNLKKLNENIKILEVGAGGEGIAKFLKYSGDFEKFKVVLTDINKVKLENVKIGIPIVANGCYLPFKDNSFDIVISVDVLEHIPKNIRRLFLKELRRVCRRMVLLHFILHDPDYWFLGGDADLKFQRWYIKTFGRAEPNTAEHINAGHPNLSEVYSELPSSQIIGTQNINVWFKYMTFRCKPIIGLFTGLIYYFMWKKIDDRPPYHGCFLKWVKKEVD